MLIYKKLAEASKLIRAVEKKYSREIGGKIRSIDDVYDGVHDAMAEAGVFSTTKILKTISEKPIKSKAGTEGIHLVIEIEFTFYAEDGSSVSSLIWGEGRGFDDKTINKCLSAAHKYALTQLFTIPVSDLPDSDKEGEKVGNEEMDSGEEQKYDQKTLSLIHHFASLDVSIKQLELYLRKPLESLSDQDFESMRALAQGMASGKSFGEMMAATSARAKAQGLMDKIKN